MAMRANKGEFQTFPSSSKLSNDINHVYSSLFENAMELSIIASSPDDASLAAKRALSYDPANNQVIHAFPDYGNSISLICQLISTCLQSFKSNQSQQNDTNQNSKNINQSNLINVNNSRSLLFPKEIIELPAKSIPWEHLGYCYLLLGDFPNAFTAFAEFSNFLNASNIKSHNPTTVSNKLYFYFCFGVVNAHFKYHIEANKCFRRCLKEIESIKMNSEIEQLIGEVYFRLAISLRSCRDYTESILYFQKAISNPPKSLHLDDIYIQIAYTLHKSGQTLESRKFYRDLYYRHPNNLIAILQYAYILISTSNKAVDFNQNNFDEGVRLLQNNLIPFHNDPRILILLGRAKMIEKDYNSAYSYFKDAISYCCNDSVFWCNLGILYSKNNQQEDALVAFQRSLYICPEQIESFINMVIILSELGQTENANRLYAVAKQNCSGHENERLLEERLGKHRSKVKGEIIDIIDEEYFAPYPNEFAISFLHAVPYLPESLIGLNGNDIDLSILATYPLSLFC